MARGEGVNFNTFPTPKAGGTLPRPGEKGASRRGFEPERRLGTAKPEARLLISVEGSRSAALTLRPSSPDRKIPRLSKTNRPCATGLSCG
jgi:hypothetical protein